MLLPVTLKCSLNLVVAPGYLCVTADAFPIPLLQYLCSPATSSLPLEGLGTRLTNSGVSSRDQYCKLDVHLRLWKLVTQLCCLLSILCRIANLLLLTTGSASLQVWAGLVLLFLFCVSPAASPVLHIISSLLPGDLACATTVHDCSLLTYSHDLSLQ